MPCDIDSICDGRSAMVGRRPLARIAAHWHTAPPWKLPYSTRDIIQLVSKGLVIPPRWTGNEFARQGRLLVLAIARLAKLTQRKAAPYVARKAVEIFRRQLEDVIRKAGSRRPGIRGAKDRTGGGVEFLQVENEAIWLAALQEVFQDDASVMIELVPPIQSVMSQSYARVGVLLGQPAAPETNQRLAREAQGIASKITRINDTTRQQFERVIRQGIEENQTVPELAQSLREKVMPMANSRSLTIARTELSRAWDAGAVESFRQSATLTHVSVIGCEGEEPNSPQYAGRSTCNYPDLPVSELDAFMEAGFHVNHTGTIVPSGFRDLTSRE
jgi:hypothetical protein